MSFTASQIAGAKNLLQNCAGALTGDRVLFAHEPDGLGYYDNKIVGCAVQAARDLGMTPVTLDVGFDENAATLPASVLAVLDSVDVIVFFARLGDQLRFSEMPRGKRISVSYALSPEMLGSGFGTAHHQAFLQVKDAVNAAIAGAQKVEVTCPRGTSFTGRPELHLGNGSDTSIRRFPMSVPTPVPAHSFSGKVAMPGFLTGTGSRYYLPYTVEFSGEVLALFANGRLTGFEGDAKSVAIAERHYDHVADILKIDRNFVHSWHAGIHPGCAYFDDARDSYERWGGSSFGNPRILHFHTCGAYAPGEISWNVIDPTIKVDGITLWESGRLHLSRLPGGGNILDRWPSAAAVFDQPDQRIGL